MNIIKNFINQLENKKLILGLIILGVVIYSVFMILVFVLLSKSPTPSTPSVGNLEQDYSSLNELNPGEATIEDVRRINGEPKLISKKGNKTYLYYDTPLEGFSNTVLIENNKVTYSIENVYGSYRGSVSDYKNQHGEPDLSLFGNNYSWYVYLEIGIALQNDGKDIGTILYFVPQSKEKFMSTVARELGMTETPIAEE